MSHEVMRSGSLATAIRSRVRPKLAIQPMTPMEIRAIGNSTFELSHFGNDRGILLHRCDHTHIEGLVEGRGPDNKRIRFRLRLESLTRNRKGVT